MKRNGDIVLVLGMHRSGTSLLAGILDRIGYFLGDRLLTGKSDNPKGFFEDAEIVSLHDRLLDAVGMRWDDPRPMPEGWLKSPSVSLLYQDLREYVVRQFGPHRGWAIKDPRICRLFPLWIRLFTELDINPKIILLSRSPSDVARSLQVRNNLALESGELLWLRYTMEAERSSRTCHRTIVQFHELQHDAVNVIQKVNSDLKLDIDLDQKTLADISEFVEPSLWHHRGDPSLGTAESNLAPSAGHPGSRFCDDEDAGYRGLASWVYAEIHQPSPNLERLDSLYKMVVAEDSRMRGLSDYLGGVVEEKHQAEVACNEAIASHAFQLERADRLQRELGELHDSLEQQRLTAMRREENLLAAIEDQQFYLVEHEQNMQRVLASRSWRMTRPLRGAAQIARVSRTRIRQLARVISPNAAEHRLHLARKIYHKLPLSESMKRSLRDAIRSTRSGSSAMDPYSVWIARFEAISTQERQAIARHQATLPYRPLISVLLPVFNSPEPYLRACIESVLAQSYPNWELCIVDDNSVAPHIRAMLSGYAEQDSRIRVHFRSVNGHISIASNEALAMAGGEFVALLDHDDTLSQDALYYVVVEINRHSDSVVIYSDEDKVDEQGRRFDPYFKPDFSYELFLGQNLISHLGVYRTVKIREVGGFREGFEGAQDWDLALRVLERIAIRQVRHIPRVLYHWRVIPGSTALDTNEKPYARAAQRRALEEHLQRVGSEARVVDHPLLPDSFHRVLWPVPSACRVAIIIPTYNGLQYLQTCVNSILEKTSYAPYEIIIIDNASDEPGTLEYLHALSNSSIVKVLRYPGPFNYAEINNRAVSSTDADVVVLLNNDTEVISPDWLEELVSYAVRPDVGAVGAKLFYADGTIQHAGVILGLGGYAAHSHRGFPKTHPGQSGRLWLSQDYSAVTAACLAVERQKYLQIGGMDAQQFPVAYNDVDFCLRLMEAGYRNVFTPYAELYHHESKTRGDDVSPSRKTRLAKEKEALLSRHRGKLASDPFYNPNLTLDREDFSIAFPPRLDKPWETESFQPYQTPSRPVKLFTPSMGRFYRSLPIPENAIQAYRGQWVSLDPEKALARGDEGKLRLVKEDPRVSWAIGKLGTIQGKKVLELGPLEGRQSYSLCRAGASEVLGIEGNAQCFQRLLALQTALEIGCLRPMLGDFVLYLEEALPDSFDLVFASGVLYHLPEPVSVLEHMARVAPRLYLWTHVYDPDLLERHPGWANRFEEEQWIWRDLQLYGARQRYVDQIRTEFCGGLSDQSLWLREESLLVVLHALGYQILGVRREPEHPNGLALGICAVRDR